MSRHLSFTLAAHAALALSLAMGLALQPSAARAADDAPTARVIVKFKSDSSLRRMQALSVGERHATQAQALGERVGVPMSAGAGIDDRTQVMFASGMTSEQLVAKLAADSNVESVSVDQRRRRTAVPNDPLYLTAGGSGPAAGQWYLRAPNATAPAAINAEAAWDITTGSNSVVVAVLDTGVRFDHPDLARVAAGGNLLPGYDFIADTATANDGGGRDDDPSDPGDWISAADRASATFRNCDLENSSWHGTQTAGLIAATTNNGVGMASVGRTVRVLPVRVLGKCGGYDSDIQAAMRWSAGLSVPGVPTNPNPARVINMSLGGSGSCGSYGAVVTEVTAAGAVVVVAAGNSAGHAVGVPANCPGAIGVGGIRHVGSKVGFSDLGPEVALSAPAGNCVNTGANEACLYPILTTSNSGTQGPVTGGSIYTDSFNSSLGTSFSAPLVSGAAALMLSVRSNLTPAEIRDRLRTTARPFPTTGASNAPDPTPVAACNAPMFDNQGQAIDQLQCYCTTSTCGAGMLDVAAAVTSLSPPLTAAISALPTSAAVGQTFSLGSAGSTVPSGRTIAGYQWTITSGSSFATFVGSSTSSTATLTAVLPGSVTVQLRITDNTGATATSTQTLTVTALPDVGGGGGGGGGGALDLTWLLALGVAMWGVRRPR